MTSSEGRCPLSGRRGLNKAIYRFSVLMSKSKFIFLLLLLSSLNIWSQESRFGIKAGPNYSSVVGDLTEGLKFRFSGHAGIFMEFELSESLKFQPELLYSSQGFQFSSDLSSIENPNPSGDQNDFRNNVQLNFITVPLLMKFGINDKLDAQVGPQFGFLINQITKTKNLNEGDGASNDRMVQNGNFQLDYGATLGLGYAINDKLSLAPRAYIGLRNRLNGLGGNLYNVNVALQLSLNYVFVR